MNISSLSGQVVLGGRVGACGQPEVFSFVVDIMNGDIKTRVQNEMLVGVQGALANPGTQLSLQRMLLDVARWSHIVGNTFTVTGSTVRFSVER